MSERLPSPSVMVNSRPELPLTRAPVLEVTLPFALNDFTVSPIMLRASALVVE